MRQHIWQYQYTPCTYFMLYKNSLFICLCWILGTQNFVCLLQVEYSSWCGGMRRMNKRGIMVRFSKEATRFPSSSQSPHQLWGVPIPVFSVGGGFSKPPVLDLTTHLQLQPSLRMSGAIPLLPLHPFMVYSRRASLYCIIDYQSDVTEDLSRLGCDAVSTGERYPTFRRIVVLSS